jgi:hypothetical protein
MNAASAARIAILQALATAGINMPDPGQRLVTVAPTSAERDSTPVGAKRES